MLDQAGGLQYGYISGLWELDQETIDKRLGVDKYLLKKFGFTQSSQADAILEAIETGKPRPDGQPGFMTPTGRYELWCTLFESCGDDPLPYYEEPPTSTYSTPGAFEEYPLVLTTGALSGVLPFRVAPA